MYNVGGDNGGEPLIFTFQYDRRSRLVESRETGNGGALISKTRYRNDQRGNPLSVRLYGGDGTLIERLESRYRVDSFGNWVEKQTKRWVRLIPEAELSFRGLTVLKRRIKYF